MLQDGKWETVTSKWDFLTSLFPWQHNYTTQYLGKYSYYN